MICKKKGQSLYYQVEEHIRKKIKDGYWKKGEQIPTELQLMELFGVSRATLRQAISNLCNEGILKREQGRGTFVSDTFAYTNDPTLIWENSLSNVYHKFISCNEEKAPTHICNMLGINKNEIVVVFSYLHCIESQNNKPYNFFRSYFKKDRFPDIDEYFFSDTAFKILRDHYGILLSYAESEFHITNLSEEIAGILDVNQSVSTFCIEKTYYDQMGLPVYCTVVYPHPMNSVLRIRTKLH